jgi:hypothetical protein
MRFIKTVFFEILANNSLSIARNPKIDAWHLHEDYIFIVEMQLKQVFYQEYMNNISSFERQAVVTLWIIVPNEKLYEFFEDDK